MDRESCKFAIEHLKHPLLFLGTALCFLLRAAKCRKLLTAPFFRLRPGPCDTRNSQVGVCAPIKLFQVTTPVTSSLLPAAPPETSILELPVHVWLAPRLPVERRVVCARARARARVSVTAPS